MATIYYNNNNMTNTDVYPGDRSSARERHYHKHAFTDKTHATSAPRYDEMCSSAPSIRFDHSLGEV